MARVSQTRLLKVLGRKLVSTSVRLRVAAGLMRPVRCPKCREYTRQRRVAKLGALIVSRQCEACKLIFTRSDSRRGRFD
jgi:hypothetical protein